MLAPPSHLSEGGKNTERNSPYHTESVLHHADHFKPPKKQFEKCVGKKSLFSQRGERLFFNPSETNMIVNS